ncbi:MAG: DNA polymerase III subunit gamma/tau [Proteobacteria bacterium]|nr:DNA polymerase III subunit gamma/tau [Pseudomonadota bacterium]
MTDGPSDSPDSATNQTADAPTAVEQGPYRVLARKYRPGTFSELIGQEALVRTLRNAIDSGRLAHAFILTGVRGVGKTTTARLIARALNCVGPDGNGGPTTDPCGQCKNCLAIAESSHVDVIEMDAASRTGVDDVREIIDSVRYAPGIARFKVYIIDEVHMLSRNAFNALLKTLEEPPEHVKFIFATTEIRKVPVTVLSRCQRFDLRRVETTTLKDHFASLAQKEGVTIDDEALSMIARAADGSVRDGLSLLDQAIAHGAGDISAAQVRDMLGLADRAMILDLFEAVMGGDINAALENLRSQYKAGADPATVLQDLLEVTHWVTQLKAAPGVDDGTGTPEAERSFGDRVAGLLPMPSLTRAWQMLLKGLEEARFAPSPMSAAEMVLIRLAYAADLPSPADLVDQIKNGKVEVPDPSAKPKTSETKTSKNTTSQTVTAPPPTPSPEMGDDPRPEPPADPGPVACAESTTPAAFNETVSMKAPAIRDEPVVSSDHEPMPQSFEQVVALAEQKREVMLSTHLTDNAHLVNFQPGRIELRLGNSAPPNLAGRLSECLTNWTGTRWVVSVSQESGAPTLHEQQKSYEQQLQDEVADHPLVKAALVAFPGAQITSVTEDSVPAEILNLTPPDDLDDNSDDDSGDQDA